MSDTCVHCEGLVKRFGEITAVAGIDLTIPRGLCFGLLGPNGAGKTTTVEMLEGLQKPTSGVLKLFGQEWNKGHDAELRQRFGVQLQETQLADKLKVREVLTLFRSFYPKGKELEELLRLVQLEQEQEQQFFTLSGGQKQRVALACALAGDPELLFLDEPTTGLDPRARKTLWSVVEEFRDKGGTVLLTTHYMEEAASLCDDIAIIDHGQIIARGSPRSLVDSLGMVQFVEFEVQHAPDNNALENLDAVQGLEVRGQHYRLRMDRSLTALQSVLGELQRQEVVPVGLSTHQASLDDVFIHLTGRALKEEQSNNHGDSA